MEKTGNKKLLNKKTSGKISSLDNFIIKKSKKDDGLTETTIKEEIVINQNYNLLDDFETLSKNRISREFFMTDGVELAKNLLGKIIVRKIDDVVIKCRIVETEAYMGPEDKAAHCYNNRKTERTKHFWNIGGCLYVYMIHNSNCLNIVANDADKPEAILIRAVEPISGIEKIKELKSCDINTNTQKKLANLTNGPGKLAASLNIDRSYNAVDLCKSNEIFLIDDTYYTYIMDKSVRININYAEEYIYKPWRFFIKDNVFVSKGKVEHKYKDE